MSMLKKAGIVLAAGMMGALLCGGALPQDGGKGAVVCAASSKEEFPVCENWFEPVKITGGNVFSYPSRGVAEYGSKYDPRDVNGTALVTAVKDQGDYNTCWAFALAAAAECNLIRNGYADGSIDLSENQFAYFFYNRQTDRLGYTAGDSNNCGLGTILEYGDEAWTQNGGTLQGAGIALSTWAGMTTEAVSGYISKPDSGLCYRHDYCVKDVFFYDYDIRNSANSIRAVKQAIMEHGAVASGIYFSVDYCNLQSGAYYCDKKDGNHAVAIVGWDDNYSVTNFGLTKPLKDGAWIVKNSYGTDKGDGGYFYVSYYDASLAELVAVEMTTEDRQYDNNYQHDGTAAPLSATNLPNGTKYANVFKAKASSASCEELKAVGVCTFSANTSYEVEIYTGLSNAGKPTSGTKAASFKGLLANAGYQTIPLPKPVALMPGEYFSVVVTLAGNSGTAQMGVDSSVKADWISFVASGGEKQSFVYYKKKWFDYYKETQGNFRIKAYTDMTAAAPSVRLSDTSAGVSKGSSRTISILRSPSNLYRSAVSWKSSNKAVATVNSKGKVKGVAYGTAKISAEVMKGAKKATLTCKVTVGPSKVQNFKVSGGRKKITVKWKRNSAASGYTIYYATEQDGTYKTLANVGSAATTKCSKNKLSAGTYYVKMRPYLKKGKTKLYGSDTAVKKVVVQ